MVKIQAEPAVTVSALTKLLSDPEPEVRAHAAMGLAACGPACLESCAGEGQPRLAAIPLELLKSSDGVQK